MNSTPTTEEKILQEFIEAGANLEHDRWAGWQKYLHSLCKEGEFWLEYDESDLIIPASLVARWKRQIDTPYSELSEEEKESDRKETRNYIPLLSHAMSSVREEERKGMGDAIEMSKQGWVEQGREEERERILDGINEFSHCEKWKLNGWTDFYVEASVEQIKDLILSKLSDKPTCPSCHKELQPDLESKNSQGEWDGHCFYPCRDCFKGREDVRVSVG